MEIALDQLPDDVAAPKADDRRTACAGRSSVAVTKKIEREIEQLELALEALEAKQAADDTGADAGDEPARDADLDERATPRRRGKPRISGDAPRELHSASR